MWHSQLDLQQILVRKGAPFHRRRRLCRVWQKYLVVVTMRRVAAEVRERGFHLTNEGWSSSEVRGAVASACWDIPATEGCALTAVEFYHPGSINPGHVHVCTALLEGVVDADIPYNFQWSAATPAISVRGVTLRWVVFDVCGAPSDVT
eukprot:COSAG02_NODE_33614_length_497_cov_1.170854_1_plen_147_part_01